MSIHLVYVCRPADVFVSLFYVCLSVGLKSLQRAFTSPIHVEIRSTNSGIIIFSNYYHLHFPKDHKETVGRRLPASVLPPTPEAGGVCPRAPEVDSPMKGVI